MTKEEMANYLAENRDKFPEYTDAEIEYVMDQWMRAEENNAENKL